MDSNYSTIKFGGFLHPPRASYSEATKHLIKVLMEEAKVTMIQRKSILRAMENGQPLPLKSTKTVSEIKNIKSEPTVPNIWKRRSQDMIINSGAYEREQFRCTSPLRSKEVQKRRLAYLMAYGQDMPPTPRKRPHYLKIRKENRGNDDYDPVEDLIKGIEERMQFLEEMENLGEGKKYRPIIEQEIGQKIRLIEALDGGQSEEVKQEIEKFKLERPAPKPFPLGEFEE